MKYPECIAKLIDSLTMLPGIGKKSAERLALNLIQWDDRHLDLFSTNLSTLKANLHFCPDCGNFSSGGLCDICADHTRDRSLICVVEQPPQISVLEQNGIYRGLYHVLGGKLKPLEGINPEDLSMSLLFSRAKESECAEVIIALSYDLEGEATSSYICEELTDVVDVSRLSTGIPLGADISYADPGTISAALNRRYKL